MEIRGPAERIPFLFIYYRSAAHSRS